MLNSYGGSIARPALVRIPIGEAMQLTLERGFPSAGRRSQERQ